MNGHLKGIRWHQIVDTWVHNAQGNHQQAIEESNAFIKSLPQLLLN